MTSVPGKGVAMYEYVCVTLCVHLHYLHSSLAVDLLSCALLMEAVIHCERQAGAERHTDTRSEIMVSTDNFRQHFVCTRSEDRLNLLTFESPTPRGFPIGW